jgi:hypothetical protein
LSTSRAASSGAGVARWKTEAQEQITNGKEQHEADDQTANQLDDWPVWNAEPSTGDKPRKST